MHQRKTIVYIDGQNFHHTLEESCGIDSRYLNFRKFFEDVLCQGKKIEAIKFYAAKYPQARDPYRHSRDASFFKHLEEKQDVKVIEGHFLVPADKRYPPREKGVDVRLATDLIFDAFLGNFEDAYVISSDTDLVPAIAQIKGNKNFKDKKIFNFSFNKLNAFIKVCDYVGLIHPNTIKKYLEPDNFPAGEKSIELLKGKFGGKK